MKDFIIKGHILYSRDPKTVASFPDSYLVCLDGVSGGVFSEIPEKYRDLPIIDFGDKLVFPGMSDLHMHAPQFPFRGLGMDLELLDWLATYTFPEEAKYQELDYAARSYHSFADHLKHSTTTRASIFATVHVPATELLMDELERIGLKTYVGKVNMDRYSPDYLSEKSAEQSLRDTEAWLCDTKDKYEHTKPILTPRFTPTCSDELMEGLHGLAEKYDVPVQSHLSENLAEIELVKKLCPWAKNYGDAYDRFGLFGGKTKCIMAHCIYSDEREIARMKENGVFIAHSPESNMNVIAGIAPAKRYLEEGLNIGLATDVAGGSHESMLRAIMHAVQASKLRWRLVDESHAPLSFQEAFYLATVGGGKFFGKVGSFEEGYDLDAVVLEDSSLDHPQPLSILQRLERAVYLSDDRHIFAKFVRGTRVL